MRLSEKIYEEVKRLPEPCQAEVLDFVQDLASRVKRQIASEENLEYTDFTLSSAMRGMESEVTPTYSLEDVKEVFS